MMRPRPVYLAKQNERSPRGFEWRGSIQSPALTRNHHQQHRATPLPVRVALFALLMLAAAATVALRALL